MLRPQIRGAFFKNGGSCALGAAIEALGLHDPSVPLIDCGPIKMLQARFPYLNEAMLQRVVMLNDCGRHTREQIAKDIECAVHRRQLVFGIAAETVPETTPETVPV